VVWRGRAIIHYASVSFCVLMVAGAILVAGGVMAWVPPMTDVAQCHVYAWLGALGGALLCAAITVKSLRLFVIARAVRKLRQTAARLTNTRLLGITVIFMLFAVVMLCVYSFADQPELHQVYDTLFEYHQECDLSTASIVAAAVIVAAYGATLILCCCFTFVARSLPVVFDESTATFLSTYNMLFTLAVTAPLFVLLENFEAKVIVAALGALLFGPGTVFIVLLPKFYVIVRGLDGSQPTAEFSFAPSNGAARTATQHTASTYPTSSV
jgi:7 transmembrane sweet-taste receptor of 3 GCPR